MSLRILHVFDHSLPLHSGYTFRSANILRGQRRLGWDTLQPHQPQATHAALASQHMADTSLFDNGFPAQQRASGVKPSVQN